MSISTIERLIYGKGDFNLVLVFKDKYLRCLEVIYNKSRGESGLIVVKGRDGSVIDHEEGGELVPLCELKQRIRDWRSWKLSGCKLTLYDVDTPSTFEIYVFQGAKLSLLMHWVESCEQLVG